MRDLLFVAVVVGFFAITVAYVKGCERMVGLDSGADAPDADADETPLEASGRAR